MRPEAPRLHAKWGCQMIARKGSTAMTLRTVVTGVLLMVGAAALDAGAGMQANAAAAVDGVDARSAFDGLWRQAGRGRRPQGASLAPCCSEEGWGEFRKMLQPWALEVMAKREAALEAGTPMHTNTAACLPDGVPTVIEIPYPFQFLRTPTHTYILHEADYQSRRIRMNSDHPANLQPSWYGDSIGFWDGNTLVVHTVGLNALGQLNWDGIPHTEQLRVIERYTVLPNGELQLQMLLTDPGTLTGPWLVTKHFRKLTDTRMLEYVCAQNNRDSTVPTE
jgi:hypothetical protein